MSQTGKTAPKGDLKSDGRAAPIIHEIPTGCQALCVLRVLRFTDTQASSREELGSEGLCPSIAKAPA